MLNMDNIGQLKREVFARQKHLAEIYQNFGDLSLFNYVDGWKIFAPGKQMDSLIDSIQRLLNPIYGSELAQDVAAQISQKPLVSTIDHHGLLNHPFFINSNLIYGLKKDLKYLVCLTTAGVSLNNSSWPGCLLLNGSNGQLKRYSFFPDRQKTQPVLVLPAVEPEATARISKQIHKDKNLGSDNSQKLESLILDIFSGDKIYHQPNFSSQACLLSSALWSKIFPSAPKIIYLPVEDLVSQVITTKIIPDSGHVLHRLFFSNTGWQLVEKYFAGSLGAFTGEHKGSFLFWGIDAKGRRLHLRRGQSSIKDQGSASFDLSPETIAQALTQGKLYPTTLVC